MKNSFAIVVFLFVYSITANSQSNGNNVFNTNIVHDIHINLPYANFWDSLNTNYSNGFNTGSDVIYIQGSVTIDGQFVDSIGLKQKGNLSNFGIGNAIKKPLKLSFSEFSQNQKFDGLKKINLSNGFDDPTLMRDALAYKFMRDAGIKCPRTSYANVYLNNTYWGLYLIVEEIDKIALKNWFGNNDGNLFKAKQTTLSYQGTQVADYADEFELLTNENSNDWTSLIHLIDIINNSGGSFEDSLTANFNVESYLKIFAADMIMSNWDSYYFHGRNFFLYENEETSNFEWIPWDYNLSFSNISENIIIQSDTNSGNSGGGGIGSAPKPLINNIQNDSELRNAYFNNICVLTDLYFTLDNLESFIDDTKELIAPSLELDTNKFFTMAQFDSSSVYDITVTLNDPLFGYTTRTYLGLKKYIHERKNNLLSQLEANGYTCSDLSLVEKENKLIKVYPNPSSDYISIESPSKISQISILSIEGKELKVIEFEENQPIYIGDLLSGVYILSIFEDNVLKHTKFRKI